MSEKLVLLLVLPEGVCFVFEKSGGGDKSGLEKLLAGWGSTIETGGGWSCTSITGGELPETDKPLSGVWHVDSLLEECSAAI